MSRDSQGSRSALVALTLVLGLTWGTPTAAQNADAGPAGVGVVAMSTGNDAPTWSRDVAPIIQRSCQQCHRPDGIGPMPAPHLRADGPVRAAHPLPRRTTHHAALAPRQDCRDPGVRERHLPKRRRDRHHRAMGRRRRARGRPCRHATAHRVSARVRVGARGGAGPARLRGALGAVHGRRQRPGPVVGPHGGVRGARRAPLDPGGGVQALLSAGRQGRAPRTRALRAGRLPHGAGRHGRRQALGQAARRGGQTPASRPGADFLGAPLLPDRHPGAG